MSKPERIKRTKGELEQELRDQLSLMQMSCEAYDKGLRAASKLIALNIRVLMHHHGSSKALLEQLGIRSIHFLDSAGPINPNNLASTSNLLVTRVSSAGAEHLSAVEAGGSPYPGRRLSFADWWNQPVIVDSKRRQFNRRELILQVADTDGGAHVDTALDEAYMDLSRKNSLGWQFIGESGTNIPLNDPVRPCIRQIAHEIITTLNGKYPQYF